LGALLYFVFKISCIVTKFDTTLLAHTLNIGFSWFLTNLFQSVPTLIVDKYFNNVYFFYFMHKFTDLTDFEISAIFTFVSLISVLMVYALLNAIEKEDIKYLDNKYKSYDDQN
jgi:hypothetical protein